uniref:Uncharacterized protein n=1 Tax=Lutzomyia longipalpis TaxID=7200 RepID=A0A1B0CQ97_LUTLO
MSDSPKHPPIVASASGSLDGDDEIRKRLDKLREDRQPKNVPTEDEMRRRLANLRGQEYKEYSNAHVFAVDNRSDQEKMNDLLKQYAEESSIREAHDPAKDVERHATIRCLGCDGDLFCRECFKDIHDDEEYRGHQTKPYARKKTAQDSDDD